MKQRELRRVGGGEPIVMAGGRATTVRRDEKPVPIAFALSIDADAEAAGRDLVARIRDACVRDKYELVSSMRLLFPTITARTPEFHALMDYLLTNQQRDHIGTILRVPGTRGPKRQNEFDLVSLIEHVMKTENIAEAREAIRRLIKIFGEERAKPVPPGEEPIPGLPAEHALRNRHSTLHKLFRIWSDSVYVPTELLTALPWTPPGYEPVPPKLVMTTLSNAIIFHSPDDSITEPKKEK